MEKKNNSLSLFQLSDATIELLNKNKEVYHRAASQVVNHLYEIFFRHKQDILGINYRLKSENSMREKIIRRKFYQSGGHPKDILDAIPDIIGIMVECEFIYKEKLLFKVIESFFTLKHENGYFYNAQYEGLFIDLDMPQPITQKNGNELYKLDCFYLEEGVKVNFELQIKSLVNSFWSEVEHNIVYKNNYYLPSDSYINEMMDSVRMNLLGLDKILSLLSGRIDALNSFTVMRDLEFNESLAMQLISDLLNDKMFSSVGFTVDTKNIRGLMTTLLLREAKRTDDEEAFYYYLKRFQSLLTQDMRFKSEIHLGEYNTQNIFKDMLGKKLIKMMNLDFEWHAFFVLYFYIHDGDWDNSFDSFLTEVEKIYISHTLFERVTLNHSEENTQEIIHDTKAAVAKALCSVTEYGIQKVSYYQKRRDELHGFLQYTLNCTNSIEEWHDKKQAFVSVVRKIITNAM